MTVRELIEQLQELDQDLPCYSALGGDYGAPLEPPLPVQRMLYSLDGETVFLTPPVQDLSPIAAVVVA